MTKYLTLLLCSAFFISCSSKKGKNFIGQWQSTKNEKQIYTISKVNETTYQLQWRGWTDPTKYDGGFPIPGELHSGGDETLTLNNQNLEFMGRVMVAYVSENELLIHNEKCTKK